MQQHLTDKCNDRCRCTDDATRELSNVMSCLGGLECATSAASHRRCDRTHQYSTAGDRRAMYCQFEASQKCQQSFDSFPNGKRD